MKCKESTVFAIMTDFSENGLGFMALCDVCRDENVEVYFDIAFNDQHKSFCFDATVMHCVPNSDKCQIGVRFDQSKPEYSCLFEKFLNH